MRSADKSYHQIAAQIEKVPKYGRGRPAKGKPRTPLHYEYMLVTKILEDEIGSVEWAHDAVDASPPHLYTREMVDRLHIVDEVAFGIDFEKVIFP